MPDMPALLLSSWTLYLQFCTVGLHLFDVCRDLVNLTETFLILFQNVLCALCVTDHHIYCLQSGIEVEEELNEKEEEEEAG